MSTVQLGYCDSEIAVCLLFWIMPTVQNREIKCHIRDIQTICNHFVQIQLWPSGQIEEQIRSFGVINKITKVWTLA